MLYGGTRTMTPLSQIYTSYRIKLLKFCWGIHPEARQLKHWGVKISSPSPQEGFLIAALQSISVWLGKLLLTLILSKIKLSIHITQDVPMIFAYPFLELTGVNKHSSIKLRKTGTVFQLTWRKHISYLLKYKLKTFFEGFLMNFKLWYFNNY